MRLPIVEEMYDEFFHDSKLIKDFPCPYKSCSKFADVYMSRNLDHNLLMGQGVCHQADVSPCKSLASSAEDSEDRGYVANPNIDVDIYLAGFLACWLCGRISADFSIFVQPEAINTAWLFRTLYGPIELHEKLLEALDGLRGLMDLEPLYWGG